MKNTNPSVLAFPIHGHHKLRAEGYRTRDGHAIEWLARLNNAEGPVRVYSRPEPVVKRLSDSLRRGRRGGDAMNTEFIDRTSHRIPHLSDRYRWWVDSANLYPALGDSAPPAPAVIWNPLIGRTKLLSQLVRRSPHVVFDLLDDWTVHYSFAGIRKEVDDAYRRMFDQCEFITANAEGTRDLAERFGRSDVILIPNGCDPERFSTNSRATGPVTVGYVGKIGRRVNAELVLRAATELPHLSFVFAGPILDGNFESLVGRLPNVSLLGDVHYEDMPRLLELFDIGWVPHEVGDGEVGGDVIKTYEYRSAGLPVLTTPVSGASARGLDNVHVIDQSMQVEWLAKRTKGARRIERVVSAIPEGATWRSKISRINRLLQGDDSTEPS